MNEQIDTALKRARGYWFVDGFIEMVAGALFLLLAVVMLVQGRAPQSAFAAWFLSATVEISIIKLTGLLAAALILWWLKDHFTYPRTGYVRGKRLTGTQVMLVLRNALLFLLLPILAILAASLLILSTSRVITSLPVWFPIAVGSLWAGLCYLGGEWLGLHRFRWLGGLVLLAGLGVGLWQFSIGVIPFPSDIQPGLSQPIVLESINRSLTGLSALVLLSGLFLIGSGMLTFLRYRRENPRPYQEEP